MGMYDNLDEYERAIVHFGNRVDVICAMEMAGKLEFNSAFDLIKSEYKELKKIRKKYESD